jgi:predicted PolB exonuclease-like 3'-5' exonuclease
MLKNPIPELALFFDMEWVPDAAGARHLFDLADDVSEIDAMQRLWEHSPAYDAEKNPRPFLKYMFSRVVSIAFLSRKTFYNRDRELTIEFGLNSFPGLPVEDADVNEAEIIERFLYSLGKRKPQLVGYNSAESDMQVLIQRGMINEVTAPEFCTRPDKPWEGIDYFKRWDNEDHLDLLKMFSSRDMTPRLDELAKMFGFPGKIDVKGDQVTELWLNRDITKIVEYNQIDVLNTYLVWLRVVYFTGKLSEEDYVLEQEQFREFLETESQKPEKAFISAFLDKWPL